MQEIFFHFLSYFKFCTAKSYLGEIWDRNSPLWLDKNIYIVRFQLYYVYNPEFSENSDVTIFSLNFYLTYI